ncbi:hypothetical protein EMIHUDRAFT_448447 [Emiliania huxleyi CCMP1516]|uniref:EamA domain-containing protein n=2 Tax=Emiliania huxleyi TaxID=2903 RepID=A0A0D3I6Y2_EMIH1|nr:hypothetical protein EMIHUDRAFT_448447 [Emiliania huxleyi CCMP1516]EOD07017.1 hypothetical protein EMIHUDRAFT_448447 [Emiliania huxleyi CCMP1516]|eukprot:XP_005759446.1 hypothetical protein EMIHUDRAFT_448447 [Emiliania huxleyi CCMP1516]
MSSTCIASPSRDSTSPPESLAATPRDGLCEPEGSLRTQRRTTAAVRRRTLALLSVGLVAGTADALLTRLAITLDGASLAEWLAIKGLASALFSSGLLLHQNGIGAVRRLPAAAARVPAHFAAGSLLHASALSCRAAAFYSTGGSAALALLLISLCPFWAALLGRVVLGDVLPRRTVAALVAATAAAAIGVILPSKPAYRWMLLLSVEDEFAGARRSAILGLDDDGFRDASFWPIAFCAGAGASLFTNACVVRAPRQVSSAEVGVVLLLESSGSLAQLAAIWTIAGYSSARDFWNPWMVAGISLLLLLIAAHEHAG